MRRELPLLQASEPANIRLMQSNGTHRQLAYPANAETRNMIEQAILAEYERIVAENHSPS